MIFLGGKDSLPLWDETKLVIPQNAVRSVLSGDSPLCVISIVSVIVLFTIDIKTCHSGVLWCAACVYTLVLSACAFWSLGGIIAALQGWSWQWSHQTNRLHQLKNATRPVKANYWQSLKIVYRRDQNEQDGGFFMLSPSLSHFVNFFFFLLFAQSLVH